MTSKKPSLDAATVEAIVIYRASLRAVEEIEARMQSVLSRGGAFDPHEFGDLQAKYVNLHRKVRLTQRMLKAMLDDLGYIPDVPRASSFH